ncbi:hypothetical protein [Litoreibacter ascidiaceicola]|uniref:hypothetical protein n=1 Tax=Litoreibacter ascidiaceicola TaxID=1486859 RepID=UPI001C31DE78|nr:hypothetical protein [Litoreibacter ascidiaceicola]
MCAGKFSGLLDAVRKADIVMGQRELGLQNHPVCRDGVNDEYAASHMWFFS